MNNRSTFFCLDQNNDLISIERLRKLPDYTIAKQAKFHLFIGRSKETAAYKISHPGRILHPEARGESWTLEKNMAFMAGGIEANNNFLIVTPITEIADRAKRGIEGNCFNTSKLGYATAEILWLADNGYQFTKCDKTHPGCFWAHAPKKKVEFAKIRLYGLTESRNAQTQVDRIINIAKLTTGFPEKQHGFIILGTSNLKRR